MASAKSELSDSYVGLARKAIAQASSKVSEMSGSAATIAAAVATDKFLLLNGEGPTRGGASVNVTVNTVNVGAAVLAPQDIAQARSLLSSVIALPALSEGQEGPSHRDCGAIQSDPPNQTAFQAGGLELGPQSSGEVR